MLVAGPLSLAGYRGKMSQAEEHRKPSQLGSTNRQLSLAIKGWMDNVLVPAMVSIRSEEHRGTQKVRQRKKLGTANFDEGYPSKRV
jgi:hypothetical protein